MFSQQKEEILIWILFRKMAGYGDFASADGIAFAAHDGHPFFPVS